MDKRFMLIALSLSLLLLISACKQGGTAAGAPTTPFLGGTSGLVIDFEEGNPPEEVTDKDSFPFNVIVKLRNDGEDDVEATEVRVSLTGINPADFQTEFGKLKELPSGDKLLGKKKDSEGNVIEGTTSFVTFPNQADATGSTFKYKEELSGNQEFTFRADVCYLYQTKAVATICALKNLITVKENALCDPSENKPVYSSSAPVQVANFKQGVAGENKITFSFDIVHSGNGLVFNLADGNNPVCPTGFTDRIQKENRVKVTVATGIEKGEVAGDILLPQCSGLDKNIGTVILSGGKRTVTCTQDLDAARSDFEKPITITLDYNYNDDKDTKVLVKHLIG